MNMKKEYRRELKQIQKCELKLWLDLRRYEQGLDRQVGKIMAEKQRARKRTQREADRLEKRRKILEGRLS